MKVLVTGYGSTGDTQPLLALAEGLRGAGHQVVPATDEGAAAAAAALGLGFRVLAGSAKTVPTEGSLGGDRATSSGRASTLPRHPGLRADLTEFLAAGEPRSTSVSVGAFEPVGKRRPARSPTESSRARPCR